MAMALNPIRPVLAAALVALASSAYAADRRPPQLTVSFLSEPAKVIAIQDAPS